MLKPLLIEGFVLSILSDLIHAGAMKKKKFPVHFVKHLTLGKASSLVNGMFNDVDDYIHHHHYHYLISIFPCCHGLNGLIGNDKPED